MPPSFVNVGAWVGPRHDGRFARAGRLVRADRRGVHLSAGVQVGGVLEPVGARPVIVEDDAFVGGGCGLYDGVIVGRRRGHRRRRDPRPGIGRLIDLVERARARRDAGRSRWSCRRARSSCPASRPAHRRLRRGEHGVASDRARHRQAARRRPPTRARRSRRRSGDGVLDRPVRPKPAARSGPAPTGHRSSHCGRRRRSPAWIRSRWPRSTARRSTSTTWTSSRHGVAALPRMPCRARVDSPSRSRPTLAGRAPSAGRGSGSGRTSPRAASSHAAVRAGHPAIAIVFTGPGKTDAELARRSARDPRHHGRVAGRAGDRSSTSAASRIRDRASCSVSRRRRRGRSHADHRRARARPSSASPFGGGCGHRPAAPVGRRVRARRAVPAARPACVRGVERAGPRAIVDGVRRLAAHRGVGRPASWSADPAAGCRWRPRHSRIATTSPSSISIAWRPAWQRRSSLARRPALAEAELLFEPGRWLTGPTGGYVVRVVRTKRRGDRPICVVDGGMHQLLRPALIGQSQRIVAVGGLARSGPAELVRVDVVGPAVHRIGRAGHGRAPAGAAHR